MVSAGEQQPRLRRRRAMRTSAYDNAMFNKAVADATPARERPRWPTRLKAPTSSSSASAPPAAWPRCRSPQAGLDVVGLEAGTWLTRARLRARRAAQQLPRLAAWRCRRRNQRSADASRSTRRRRPRAPRGHPMMNARRRHHAALLGAELAAEPVGLQGGQRDRRAATARSRIPKGSTVEDWPFGFDELEPYYDKVEYEIGVSGQAGNINGTIDPRGNIFEGAAHARLPDAAAARHRLHRRMTAAARGARLASVPGPGGDQLARATRTARRACITASATAAAATSTPRTRPHVTTIPRAQETGRLKVVTRAHVTHDRGRRRSGRVTGVTYVTDGEEYFQPAKVVLLASYTYENVAAAAAVEVEGVPERAVEQPRPGRPPLLQPRTRARR